MLRITIVLSRLYIKNSTDPVHLRKMQDFLQLPCRPSYRRDQDQQPEKFYLSGHDDREETSGNWIMIRESICRKWRNHPFSIYTVFCELVKIRSTKHFIIIPSETIERNQNNIVFEWFLLSFLNPDKTISIAIIVKIVTFVTFLRIYPGEKPVSCFIF